MMRGNGFTIELTVVPSERVAGALRGAGNGGSFTGVVQPLFGPARSQRRRISRSRTHCTGSPAPFSSSSITA